MNNISKRENFSLTPSNLEEAMRFADLMSKSTVVPKQYQGKPGDILVAVQMGADLGLKPMQALQNIAVINGRPSIWGDALLAIVQAHPQFEDIEEYIKDGIAYCTIKRKGQKPYTATFSLEDAKKAKLLGKPGPWQDYPNRMLQLRARGFALRDKFADALGGIISSEEAQDYPVEEKIVENKVVSLESKLDELLNEPTNQPSKEELVNKLLNLVTNKKIDDGFEKMCSKLEISSVLEMSEEQLIKAIEWAEKHQEEI